MPSPEDIPEGQRGRQVSSDEKNRRGVGSEQQGFLLLESGALWPFLGQWWKHGFQSSWCTAKTSSLWVELSPGLIFNSTCQGHPLHLYRWLVGWCFLNETSVHCWNPQRRQDGSSGRERNVDQNATQVGFCFQVHIKEVRRMPPFILNQEYFLLITSHRI